MSTVKPAWKHSSQDGTLRKLADVPADQRPRAIGTIAELGQMYGEHDWQSQEAQEFWSVTVSEVTEKSMSGDN